MGGSKSPEFRVLSVELFPVAMSDVVLGVHFVLVLIKVDCFGVNNGGGFGVVGSLFDGIESILVVAEVLLVIGEMDGESFQH